MRSVTVHEFDALVAENPERSGIAGATSVPRNAFAWLEAQCLRSNEEGGEAWLRRTLRQGRHAVQVTNYVGVIRAPDGFQIEVLPKVAKVAGEDKGEVRRLLIDMLCCLRGFRHIQTNSARLDAKRMPLFEVFIAEFLRAVEHVVKRGLRSQYVSRQDNVFALRGKLLIAPHLRQNVQRADRFFTEHDEFSTNRPENRLLHAALRHALISSELHANQQLAREMSFVFADIPASDQAQRDFALVRVDRGMSYYADALAWARLLLEQRSPLMGIAQHRAPSLLFPMEAVFEAFVAKHVRNQVTPSLRVTTQPQSHHLVRHREQNWFRLKPDLVVRDGCGAVLVLDTKWKLLDRSRSGRSDKYGLSQSDFYQLKAYGESYLKGKGDVVLIYPGTAAFDQPLPVFNFSATDDLRLWVVPFCLKRRAVLVPQEAPFAHIFGAAESYPNDSTVGL
jgi:5-methylcytosine-specific restriction enzyme subunit McrC